MALLEVKSLQCYRCLEKEHVRAMCKSAVDRSSLCYKCGGTGDCMATRCAATARCLACAAKGRSAAHRIGGPACYVSASGGRGKITKSEEEGKRRTAAREAGSLRNTPRENCGTNGR